MPQVERHLKSVPPEARVAPEPAVVPKQGGVEAGPEKMPPLRALKGIEMPTPDGKENVILSDYSRVNGEAIELGTKLKDKKGRLLAYRGLAKEDEGKVFITYLDEDTRQEVFEKISGKELESYDELPFDFSLGT